MAKVILTSRTFFLPAPVARRLVANVEGTVELGALPLVEIVGRALYLGPLFARTNEYFASVELAADAALLAPALISVVCVYVALVVLASGLGGFFLTGTLLIITDIQVPVLAKEHVLIAVLRLAAARADFFPAVVSVGVNALEVLTGRIFAFGLLVLVGILVGAFSRAPHSAEVLELNLAEILLVATRAILDPALTVLWNFAGLNLTRLVALVKDDVRVELLHSRGSLGTLLDRPVVLAPVDPHTTVGLAAGSAEFVPALVLFFIELALAILTLGRLLTDFGNVAAARRPSTTDVPPGGASALKAIVGLARFNPALIDSFHVTNFVVTLFLALFAIIRI